MLSGKVLLENNEALQLIIASKQGKRITSHQLAKLSISGICLCYCRLIHGDKRRAIQEMRRRFPKLQPHEAVEMVSHLSTRKQSIIFREAIYWAYRINVNNFDQLAALEIMSLPRSTVRVMIKARLQALIKQTEESL